MRINSLNRRNFTYLAFGLLCSFRLTFAAEPESFEADVIVIGSGAAGLAAALTAAGYGKSVIILEKMPVIGGNSLLSTGLINAPDPERQKLVGIEDSNDLFFKQTYEAGHRSGNQELIKVMVENALPTVQWLEKYGIHFKEEVIQIYGGLWPRGHNPKVSHGRGYINFLSKACKERGIPIKTNTQAVSFIRGSGERKNRITGVKALVNNAPIEFKANCGVIIATGGFTANQKLCAQLDPRLQGMNYTGSPSATGDIFPAVKEIGGQLKDLKEIQCNLGPVGHFNHRSGYHSDVKRHILVNKNGLRFVAEDGLRDKLRDAVLSQPDGDVFIIIDSDGYQDLSSKFQQSGATSEALGYGWKADSVKELAQKMNISPRNLEKTVDEYNQAVASKKDPFGREPWMLVKTISHAPFYASKARMAIHYTMGGIVIDAQARVLDEGNVPIEGLFAAGEATTGIHGTNRVGGNGILDAFVFGRIAGQSAANQK